MPIKKLPGILVLVVASLVDTAAAEPQILGFVKRVEGEAYVLHEQTNTPASEGLAIFLGDKISTGENGRLGMTFKDNTIMSFGPDTELVVDQYSFEPAEDRLALAVSMLKGTLHYISGVIAKLRPEAVTVKTPAGIIGVRGTRFLVKAEAE
jgi:hypothetical protein